MFDKETLQITRQGNAELLQVLRTGVYKDKDLAKIGSVKALRKEYKKMFDYIMDNSGYIDISDKRFMIEEVQKNYYDYSQWDKIRTQSLEFRT